MEVPHIKLTRKQIIIGVIGLLVLIALIIVITGLFIKNKKDGDMYEALIAEKNARIEQSREHEEFIKSELQDVKNTFATAMESAAEDRKAFLANQKNYLAINARYDKVNQRTTDVFNAGDDAIRAAFHEFQE